MQEVTLTGLPAAPIIVALVAALGQALPALPRRAYPMLAIALGIAWNVAAAAVLGQPLSEAALVGIATGLAASGLYSAAVKPALDVVSERGKLYEIASNIHRKSQNEDRPERGDLAT